MIREGLWHRLIALDQHLRRALCPFGFAFVAKFEVSNDEILGELRKPVPKFLLNNCYAGFGTL